jgi:UDP-2,3-diacylglucosamine pyrophosphatase LpxH
MEARGPFQFIHAAVNAEVTGSDGMSALTAGSGLVRDFSQARHTLVVSDIHLSDAEPPHPFNPLWKRFKRREYFIDPIFARFLDEMNQSIRASDPSCGEIELVLNGDIFDFDSVMKFPSKAEEPDLNLTWLERMRGMNSEEVKSRWKLRYILDDHPELLAALRRFLENGNRLVFVLGNHDIEFHWPSLREDLLDRIGGGPDVRARIRICEWFFISNKDTLIEHGNQYDSYTLCQNPINPLIRRGFKPEVRIPFGNLAGKVILNGIGLMNPHANSSFIKSSFIDYIVFYFKYVLRTQPWILWTFLWSAAVTLVISVLEGLLPAMRDPITTSSRVEDIARRSNATSGMVLSLFDLHVHPAIYNPIKILRELWLDRFLLLLAVLIISFEVFIHGRVFIDASAWWILIPLGLLLPFFIFYARSVESELAASEKKLLELAPLSARITGVNRVIQGHSHQERHEFLGGVEYLNTGTWSYAYHDVECTQPYGNKCFAWLRPDSEGSEKRKSDLYIWSEKGATLVPVLSS